MRAGRQRSQRNGATYLEISTETVNKLWIKHDHVRPSSCRTRAFSVLHSRAAFTEARAASELKAVSSRLFPDRSRSHSHPISTWCLERRRYSSNRFNGFAS